MQLWFDFKPHGEFFQCGGPSEFPAAGLILNRLTMLDKNKLSDNMKEVHVSRACMMRGRVVLHVLQGTQRAKNIPELIFLGNCRMKNKEQICKLDFLSERTS